MEKKVLSIKDKINKTTDMSSFMLKPFSADGFGDSLAAHIREQVGFPVAVERNVPSLVLVNSGEEQGFAFALSGQDSTTISMFISVPHHLNAGDRAVFHNTLPLSLFWRMVWYATLKHEIPDWVLDHTKPAPFDDEIANKKGVQI